MATEKKDVNVAILGLGRVGSTFLEKLTEKERQGIKIVAAAEPNQNSEGVKIAKDKGIRVYSDSKDVIALGEGVDIIFDLTGNPDARKALRSGLAQSGNQNTVVAPEVIAFLVWDLMGGGAGFPSAHTKRGY